MFYTIWHADTGPDTPRDREIFVMAANILDARRQVFALLRHRRDSHAAAWWEINGCPLWAIRYHIELDITRDPDTGNTYTYDLPF